MGEPAPNAGYWEATERLPRGYREAIERLLRGYWEAIVKVIEKAIAGYWEAIEIFMIPLWCIKKILDFSKNLKIKIWVHLLIYFVISKKLLKFLKKQKDVLKF